MEIRDDRAPQIGDLAPNFTLPTLEGSVFTLDSLRGRWTILFTWASW